MKVFFGEIGCNMHKFIPTAPLWIQDKRTCFNRISVIARQWINATKLLKYGKECVKKTITSNPEESTQEAFSPSRINYIYVYQNVEARGFWHYMLYVIYFSQLKNSATYPTNICIYLVPLIFFIFLTCMTLHI